jgi:succinate dehydrogenase / fumarate reductase cytochrome b subunit
MHKGAVVNTDDDRSFLARHEFLIRRIHSLTGLVPVGAYMLVHMLVNLTVLPTIGGPGMYQKLVYQIHGLGGLLPFVEWGFIFGPILFHGVIGLIIVRSGLSNTGSYPYPANIRYSLQRITGILAFAFIGYHVFHMHGWFHFDAWRAGVLEPLAGAQFKPFSAASTLSLAMRGFWIPAIYFVGLVTCTFHLVNGLWTIGITWGVWTSPKAQKGAAYVCGMFGVFAGVVAAGAWLGSLTIDRVAAQRAEDRMFQHKIASGEISEFEAIHKRADGQLSSDGSAAPHP